MISPNDDCKWVWLGGGGANFLVAFLRLNAQTKKYGGRISEALWRELGAVWRRCE